MERMPRANKIKTKKEQIIKMEKMSVEDVNEYDDLRDVPRGNDDLDFNTI